MTDTARLLLFAACLYAFVAVGFVVLGALQ
jgi:hypothetical protein